jgi:hypothetical protein
LPFDFGLVLLHSKETMNTLYITESGAILHVKNQQLQVLYKQEVRQRVPIHQVEKSTAVFRGGQF